VAVRGEDQPAAGQRTRAHVQDAIVEPSRVLLAFAHVARPLRGAGVRRPFLMRKLDELPCLDVDLEDVRSLERRLPVLAGPFQSLEMRIENPLAIEGNVWIGD